MAPAIAHPLTPPLQPMNLPTWITVSRLLGVPAVLALLASPTEGHRWWALGIFLVAAGTDWLDGFLARRLNQVTDLGKFLDPLVDKLLVVAPLLVVVAWGRVAPWLAFVIIGRELTVAGWRVNQTTISGANWLGKLKTVVQIAAIAVLLAPAFDDLPALGDGAIALAALLSVVSGAVYLRPARSASSLDLGG